MREIIRMNGREYDLNKMTDEELLILEKELIKRNGILEEAALAMASI